MAGGPRVIVVGAGAAGLTCARNLASTGIGVTVVEAADGVGGRVRSDRVDGFTLDRGFQILLAAYPEARRALDYDALDLRPFEPGALIFKAGKFHRLSDPWRRPSKAVATALSGVGTLADKLRVAVLRAAAGAGSTAGVFTAPEHPTEQTLRSRYGFSNGMIDEFFRPFLGGVFLERNLATSDRLLYFVFRMFAAGAAAVPTAGMGAIPDQLAAGLPPGSVRLKARVEELGPTHAVLVGGERLGAEAVVLATDGDAAARLAGGAVSPTAWNGTACLYFAADRPPRPEPILMLNGNGNGNGPANVVVVPSNVSPAYAPPGQSLISVSTVGVPGGDDDSLRREVLDQLRGWFGSAVDGWRHLRTYRIPQALPTFVPPTAPPDARAVRLESGLFVCGDYLAAPSLNAAMGSGRRAAEAVRATFA